MNKILEIAKKELEQRGKDFKAYYLGTMKQSQDNPNEWLVIFEKPDSEDAKIELVIDAVTSRVSSYKDSWA